MALYGNAYVQVIKSKDGMLHSLYTLPPDTVKVVPYLETDDTLHLAYIQNIAAPRVYLEDEIIHFKLGNAKSFIYGKPLFLPQLAEISTNINAIKSVSAWFEQGYTGGAIFKMDAAEDVAQRNREYIREYFTKPENFGRTLLLEGDMELVRDGNKFENFDFSALTSTNRDNIIMAAGVPLSQAGMRSDSGNANAEIVAAEETAFMRNTVDMYHKLVYHKLNARLFRDILDMRDLEIYPGAPSKFSLKNEIEIVNILAATVGISIGEARELLSMQPVPSEDVNNTYVLRTNNGAAPAAKVIGKDYSTGEEVDNIFDITMESQKAANSIANTKGVTGLGGDFKKGAEG